MILGHHPVSASMPMGMTSPATPPLLPVSLPCALIDPSPPKPTLFLYLTREETDGRFGLMEMGKDLAGYGAEVIGPPRPLQKV